MPLDSVLTYVSNSLINQGFTKVKKSYHKDLGECKATIEFQNNSFEKAQHFLNLTIDFHPDIAKRNEIADNFAAWARIESLDSSMYLQNLEALNASSNLLSDIRNQRLEKIISTDLINFLKNWTTFDNARLAYKATEHKHAPINHELKLRWERNQ